MRLVVLGSDSKVGQLIAEKAHSAGYETANVSAHDTALKAGHAIKDSHAAIIASDAFMEPETFTNILESLQKADTRRVVLVLQDIWLQWQGVPRDVLRALQHLGADWTIVCLLPKHISKAGKLDDFNVVKDDIAGFVLGQVTESNHLQQVVMLQK